ncbi:hypothetical protein SAY87_016311 [Trapa incisa]|uniref:Outer envelope pore protein 16, chloroplastic n=1 Tax=Trapa incisa TaxID=236973 RepID=A0AAN7LF79_9MYRT|nr:hypothetical protein SAY87_016311 [Trapa incisa]
MPRSRLSGTFLTPKVDVVIDMGNPFLNLALDGFIKIGAVAVTRVAAEDAYYAVKSGNISSGNLEHSLKKMCKEGAYWGTVAGVYAGMERGVQRIRGTRDWKNAMIGGAMTGLVISAASNNNKNFIIVDAITGGAIATAAEFINYLT